MILRIPIIPTIFVLGAVATMIALGFWQLGRAEEKAALIEQYKAALADDVNVVLSGFASPESLFKRTVFQCAEVLAMQQRSGRSARGQSGWAHVATCRTAEPEAYVPIELTDYSVETVSVSIGWSRDPVPVEWAGGTVEGRVILPGDEHGRVVADAPLAGLEPLAKPDPSDLPNNHLAYTGQWFFFALTALLIYGFALRARLSRKD